MTLSGKVAACRFRLAAARRLVGFAFLALSLAPATAEDPSRERGPGDVWENDGRRWLYGGRSPDQHFDVTEFRLDPAKLDFGLGREVFAALIEPEFAPPSEMGDWLSPRTKVLGVAIGDEARAYPLPLMRTHEVVNDVVGGRAIFVAHCILADIAVVYDRTLAGHTYTFAVSGYTYGEGRIAGGKNAFVLWDRDTESLWLPTIGRAVSGPLIDAPLQVTPRDFWTLTTWGAFRRKHPDAVVLRLGQEMEPPEDFPRYRGPFPETAGTEG